MHDRTVTTGKWWNFWRIPFPAVCVPQRGAKPSTSQSEESLFRVATKLTVAKLKTALINDYYARVFLKYGEFKRKELFHLATKPFVARIIYGLQLYYITKLQLYNYVCDTSRDPLRKGMAYNCIKIIYINTTTSSKSSTRRKIKHLTTVTFHFKNPRAKRKQNF